METTSVGNLAIFPWRKASAVELDQLIVFYHESQIVIDQNDGYDALNISTFKEGMPLSLADVDDFTGFFFTDKTAEIYFDSRHALRSFKQELNLAYKQIDDLQQSQPSTLLEF
jgi:hypothetical protein